MAKGMETSRARYARDSQSVEHRVEHITAKNVRVKRVTIRLAEHEVLWVAERRLLSLLSKGTQQAWPEVDRSDAPLGLGRQDLAFPKGLPDLELLCVKINVLPLES